MKYKYKFSVIIPIYNVEKYLEATIKSVINQTIGFKNNIQLILINDGSPDNSEEICLKYQKKYPENIIYKKIKNSGVSVARNEGIKYIEGEYVNFLDSDDKWEKDVFKKVYKMFKKDSEVNIIGVREKFFEAAKGYTSLDYKFDSDKIVDITKEYDHIQLSVSAGFIKSALINDIRFDSRIKYSEDAKFIYEYLMNNNATKLGIISSSLYLYRKRTSGDSAIQTKDKKLSWYEDTVKFSYLYLLEKAKETNSPLFKTISYYVMYDYQWRITYNLSLNLNFSKKAISEYLEDSKKIFDLIDDDIVCEQKKLSQFYKELILYIKYKNLDKTFNIFLEKVKNKCIDIKICEEENDFLMIEGCLDYLYNDDFKLFYKVGHKYHEIVTEKDKITRHKNMFDIDVFGAYFKTSIKFTDNSKIEFYLEYENIKYQLDIKYKFWSKMSDQKNSSYRFKNYTIYNKEKHILVKRKNSIDNIKNEILYEYHLLKNKHLKSIIYRILYYIFNVFNKKPIWIISDRKSVAGDNGEALFKYINQNDNNKHKVYFAIDKNSKDVERLKKYGKVLYFDTHKYKIYFLMSKCIISSHADPYVFNPYGKSCTYIKDLLHFKYIFLQHGIIRHDMSDWLNRFNRNFSIFVTTSKEEYDLILNDEKYGYNKNIVKLTGLARYDNLIDNSVRQNIIMLAPTWRSNLVGSVIPNTQDREYNCLFKESDFCKFYNKLFSDKDILDVLDKYKYKIHCCFHPSLKNQIKDFKTKNENILIVSNVNYNNEFCNSKLLITDYSSVVFDFAYLKKAVIYNMFDIDTFYEGHIYNLGNYDIEKEGFGEVAYNYEELKKILIEYIKNDCKIKQKYLDRINNYFYFHDQNNCKRIYEEILKKED